MVRRRDYARLPPHRLKQALWRHGVGVFLEPAFERKSCRLAPIPEKHSPLAGTDRHNAGHFWQIADAVKHQADAFLTVFIGHEAILYGAGRADFGRAAMKARARRRPLRAGQSQRRFFLRTRGKSRGGKLVGRRLKNMAVLR